MSEHTSALDALIDRYLAHERHDHPHLGYPSIASGTQLARPNRQWQSSNETLEESNSYAELSALEGAWASLSRDEEAALRADALNRHARATVWRAAGKQLTDFAVQQAKLRLKRLLSDRGIFA